MKNNRGIDLIDLYEKYYKYHDDELVENRVKYDLEDEYYIQDIMNDNEFTTIEEVKDYLYNYYNNCDWDTFEDEIKEAVNSELETTYNDSFIEVRDLTEDFLHNLEKLTNLNITLKIKESHSWNAGDLPSIYFIIYLDNNDIYKSLEIRFSDLHDNNRNDSDIEVNWYKLDLTEYRNNLIDLLDECLVNDFDIELSYNDFNSL